MSSHKNSYRPPAVEFPRFREDEEYDLNFCFLVPDEIQSERVKLVPFIPSSHTEQYLLGTKDHPELYRYLPYGPFKDKEDFYCFIQERIATDPGTVLFAIIDKTKPDPERPVQGGTFAGVIAYLNTLPLHLSTEIGHLLILPAWHRTFLTTNAVGLLLRQGLELPENGGWGLRRYDVRRGWG
ncbi:hypothetical protein FRC03_004721 [Tulasnella sp. 419]|nr:hypothetical protein FRC03_004721 [Tulasnella sp. 419]